jgi:phospholipid transport system substrate-binding protein
MNTIVFLKTVSMRNILTGCLLVLTVIPALAAGDQPIEALQRGVEEGFRILNNPEFNNVDRKDAQQHKLRIILGQLFDFREFSKRVLAAHWKDFTPSQREAFIRLFAEFLGRLYMGRLQEKYKNERLIYVSQEMISASLARVHVKVVWKAQEIPVDLRMIKRKGQWKVYDIQVLGISAVRNYRAQFKSLLSKETPAQVIERLKIKIGQLEKTDQKR